MADIIRKFLDENPEITAHRRIAIILCDKYPKIFTNVENARSRVRDITGNMGASRRKTNNHEITKYFRSTLPDIVSPPVVDTSAYVIPDDIERMAVWNDLHGPWFEKGAIERALLFSDADTLYLNGDVADFYWLSKFGKDVKMQDRFQHELEKLREFLAWVRDKFDNVYYKLANHEDRLPHYLARNNIELANLPELQPNNLLKLDELGIKIVGSARHAEFGDLDIIHGHEVRIFGGVNLGQSYAKVWQRYKKKMDVRVMFAHHHIFNEGIINNFDGTKAYGYGNGCLCQKSVEYAPKNAWEHGFSMVTRSEKGTIVEPIKL